MTDIVLTRQTYILVSDNDNLLYPREDLFPSQDLYPAEMVRIDKIVQGTLKLDEILVESELQFGQLYATKFEVQMYDTEDLSGKLIYVFQNDGYEDYRVFAGIIDSCKLDRVGTDRTIVAYDLAYSKSYTNVAPWWKNFWSSRTSATLKEMRESLLGFVGVPFENVELPNDRISLTKTCDINSIGFGAMLKMICELSCCFPHIDRSGTMIFIILNNDSSVDITGKYDWAQSTFEEYVTESITGVQFYTTNSDLTAVVGNSTNPYSVQENILVYKKTETELQEIGQNMMDYIPEIVYTPSSVNMIISDFRIHIGDYIHTEKADFYVLKMSCNGRQLIEQNLTASGSQRRDEVAKDIAFDAVIAQEQLEQAGEEISDTVDIIQDMIEVDEEISDYVDGVQEDYEAADKELERRVASSQVEWDTNRYQIDEFGYGSPEVDYNITYVWDLTSYTGAKGVDKLPSISSITDSEFDGKHYYYLTDTGAIYIPVKTSFALAGNQVKSWRKVGALTKKGEIKNANVDASDVGKTYLDQNAGILYQLQKSGNRYVWKDIAHLQKVTVRLETKIEQNSEAITMEASKRYAEDSYQMAQIRIAADNITQEVTRAKGAENTLSSRIAQSAHSIELSTTDGAKTARITIRIRDENGRVLDSASDNITLTGVVGFEDLSGAGRTVINGANIRTGVIDAQRINLATIASNTGEVIAFKNTSGIVIGNRQYGTAIDYGEITCGGIKRNSFGLGGNLQISGETAGVSFFGTQFYFGNAPSYFNGDIYARRIRGDNNGAFDIASNGLYIYPSGTFYINGMPHGSTSDRFVRISSSGYLYYTTGSSTDSSRRYKYDIKPIENIDLNPHKILDIPVKQFKFNHLSEVPPEDQNKDVIGMVAEDVAEIYPVAAVYRDGKIENWNERYIIPPMLSLIQEMYQKINVLENKIKELGGN